MDIFKQLSSNNDIANRFSMLSSAVEANGLTVVDLLSSLHFSTSTNLSLLSKKLGRSIREVEEYLNLMKETCEDSSKRILLNNIINKGVVDKNNFIPTGLEILDQQLNGGIPLGQITEIFGASGCGKSQFLLQLSIHSQLLGDCEESQCIYISTESPLETRRLEDMIDHHNYISDKNLLMDNISCIYCQDLESQDHAIFTQLPVKLSQAKGKIKTIIIDSISHHLRIEEAITNTTYLYNRIKDQEVLLADCKDYTEVRAKHEQQLKTFFKATPKYQHRIAKSQYLMLLHRHLLTIAKENNIAVIMANQISDHPENTTDLSMFDDAGDALNLEYQLGEYSGWDNKAIFKHQQLFGENLEVLSSKDSDLAYSELMRSIDQLNNVNKRQKLILPQDESEIDPRYQKYSRTSIIEDQHSYQKDLIMKLHKLNNCQTKKIVPALGYQWSKNMVSRLLLMKTYRPLLKEKDGLATMAQAIDPETNLTYEKLCEGFNVSTQNNEDASTPNKRKAANYNSNNNISSVESLFDEWSVERYVKVVASPFDSITNNSTNNENSIIPFQITKHGIDQVQS